MTRLARSLSGFALTGALLILAGCESQSVPLTAPPPRVLPAPVVTAVAPDQAEPEESTKPAEVAVKLEVASWEELQKVIASLQGKIVVLDLWSSYCEPCLKEFPHLVALQEQYPDDVVCLSLNCNYDGSGSPEEQRELVAKFLGDQQAKFRNFLNSDADLDLYKKVNIASIPVVQVYSRDGQLAKQFDNEKDEYGKDGFNYEKHISPFVETLVKDK